MSTLSEVGDRDAWRCWLCDEPVDPEASVNADRGPSVDSGAAPAKGKKKAAARPERLAHRSCNTRKGAVQAVVPWSPSLFVLDPAPIVAVVDRLTRKGGREVVARCPTQMDADEAGTWLLDRVSRLAPDLPVTMSVEQGGGQFLLVLRTA
ncbi:MAG: hypothetical protein JWN88_1837 [Frankiales bacterium]|jgi:hypothetical protein|nr:hypothetical protein [Frankiales bacterium]